MQRLSIVLAGLSLAAALMIVAPPALAMNSSDSDTTSSSDDYNKGVKAVEARNYRAAIRLFASYLREEPRNADALNYMGYSHRKIGDYKKALTYYQRALKVDPDHRGANEYLGEAYLELKNLPKAEERLSHLWNICGANCEEYVVLNQAIEAYKAGRKPSQSSSAGRW